MKELPTLQELQSFIAYNKMGNFTLAAQSMNITQSAFSAQMKKLERLVGVKLIARSTRGSCLTQEGERFLPEAEAVIETLERAVHTIRLSSKLERPMLNIGMLRSMGDVRLNSFVAHFYENNPDFSISVFDMEEEELLLDLRENRIDIGFVYLPNNKDMSMYESVALRDDSIVYYAPKSGIPVGTAVSAQQISDIPMVTYPPKYFMSRALKSYFSDTTSNQKPRGSRLSNPYAMVAYCDKNRAGAMISKRFLDELGVKDGYYELEKPVKLQVCFVYRKGNSKWETMKIFMDYVSKDLLNSNLEVSKKEN